MINIDTTNCHNTLNVGQDAFLQARDAILLQPSNITFRSHAPSEVPTTDEALVYLFSVIFELNTHVVWLSVVIGSLIYAKTSELLWNVEWVTYFILTKIIYLSIEISIKRLTHWGRVTHICVSKITIIGSVNGLSPERRQAIICTNVGILLIGRLGTNLSEILIKIYTF